MALLVKTISTLVARAPELTLRVLRGDLCTVLFNNVGFPPTRWFVVFRRRYFGAYPGWVRVPFREVNQIND